MDQLLHGVDKCIGLISYIPTRNGRRLMFMLIALHLATWVV